MGDASWGELALKAIEVLGVKKLIAALLDRPHYIIVIGSTGVGKSALTAALSSVEQQIVATLNRTERLNDKKTKIGNITTVIVDTPGEISKIASRLSDMARAFNKPRVGILMVVADGFHQYRGSAVAEVGTASDLAEYLSAHRRLEREFFRQFASRFPFAHQVDWALTVATKADLWWDDSDRVLASYTDDEFSDIASRICRHGAPPRPFSSATEPFLDKVPGASSFGEGKRREVRSSFLQTLIEQMAN